MMKRNNKLSEFGKEMRKIRVETGDSLRSMAEKIDISQQYLSRWELGKINISQKSLDKIVNYIESKGMCAESVKRFAYLQNGYIPINQLDRWKQELIIKLMLQKISDDKMIAIEAILRTA